MNTKFTLFTISFHFIFNQCTKEMQESGIGISELNTKLLQKIEELTLYIIDQEKRISNFVNK